MSEYLEFTAKLQQANRENNVTGPAFFYLMDGQNIDFTVKGVYPNSWNEIKDGVAYGEKFAVNDAAAWNLEGAPFTPIDGLGDGDIVIKVSLGYEIFYDASNSAVKGNFVYNEFDGNLWVLNADKDQWAIVQGGSISGGATPGGDQWSIQFHDNATVGGFSGNANFEFDAINKSVNLGPNTVIRFGDGTTQDTARKFYGATTYAPVNFPQGFSANGYTGDRLLLATGPSADPFRNYIRFGNHWFQYGVAGIGSGPAGSKGDKGDPGTNGVTGATGVTGAAGTTGVGLTAVSLSGDTGILRAKYVNPDGSFTDYFDIGYARGETGKTGATGSTGSTGATGATGYVGGIQWIWKGAKALATIQGYGTSDEKFIAQGTVPFENLYINKTSLDSIVRTSLIQSWDDSTNNGIKGYLTISDAYTGTSLVYSIATIATLGAVVDNSFEIVYTAVSGSPSDIADGRIVSVNFSRAGNLGSTGSTGATGATGGRGATGFNAGLKYLYTIGDSNGVTDGGDRRVSDPQMGDLALNTSGTELFLHVRDSFKQLHSGFIATWDDSNSTTKGHVQITPRVAGIGSTGHIVFALTSLKADTSDGYSFNGSLVSGTTGKSINLGEDVSVVFTPAGYRGQTGATGSSLTGTTGATGVTGTGLTAVSYNQVTGILSASYLSGLGAQSSPFDIGYIRGHTGGTGPTGTSGLTGFEPNNSNLVRTTNSFTTTGLNSLTARKVIFLQDDGSLTAGYILTQNIFSASDFQFAITSFSTTPGIGVESSYSGSRILRLRNNWYDLYGNAGVTFNVVYRGSAVAVGSGGTGSIFITVANEGLGDPIYFPTDAMTSIPGNNSGNALQITGIGGVSDNNATLRVSVTGQNFGNQSTDTEDITVKFRNDFLYGVTTGTYLTTFDNVGWTRDYTSEMPEKLTVNGYFFSYVATGGANPYYAYFAFPKRLTVEATVPTDGVKFYNREKGEQTYQGAGGWNLQGYGLLPAEGLSTINYTNAEGYIEPYLVWRTVNGGLGDYETSMLTGGNYTYTRFAT
jgi:hypothetical protein